ncbi:hypothetical protein M8J75_000754 [Diaphorina citri]|nr:hypothetical protein M8J75_000754 [Diaphorina citri]
MSSTPSFRFNAHQEELVELTPDESDSDQQASSTPSDSGTRDGSPFRRFGKRSTSVDSNNVTSSVADTMSSSATTAVDNPWSFLHGIKERIEDKLDEIKKERQQKINEKKLSLNKHPEPALPVNEESNEANENKKKTEVVIEKKTQEIEEKTEKDQKKKSQPSSSSVVESKDKKADTPTQSLTTSHKMKSKFADLKRKFKSESESTTEERVLDTTLPNVIGGEGGGGGGDTDEDFDMVEMAQEAGADDTLRPGDLDSPRRSPTVEFHQKLAFSCLPHTSCRTPGLIETLGTMAVSNLKLFLLSLALVGLYLSVYPLLVAFMLGSLFAMELSSILDWIKETFFLWTDSNSEYLIVTNPYLMTKPVPIFDKRSLKPIQPHRMEYVGWLNEFKSEYSPEKYHLSLTETVYAQLTGSLLRISEPRVKIPKRAVWNEPQLKLLFNVARLYNISNCQVLLLPHGIIRQRIWNRKYPICIVLRPDSHVGMKFRNKDQSTITEEEPWLPFEIPDPVTPSTNTSSSNDPHATPKMKSKSTESFLTLHETLKQKLEKSKEEAEVKARKPDSNILSDSEGNTKPNILVRRKRSAPKIESEMKEENCDDTPEHESNSLPVKPSTLGVPKRTLDSEDDDEEDLCEEEEEDGTASPDLNFHIVEHEDGVKPQHFLMESDAVLKHQEQNESYVKMMTNLHQTKIPDLPPASKETNMPRTVTDLKDEGEVSEQLMFINAILGRSLFDVFRNQRLRCQIQNKLQRKLNAIRVPRFLGQLNISKLEFSNNSPIITQASKPRLDENGE